MKIKNIKPKVEKKVGKAKAKIAKKCGKGAKCAAVLIALGLAVTGCQSVPSRSQSITFKDSTVNIYGCGTETNEVARIEMLTQAMAIETSGTESQNATQTTDTKPDVDVTVGGKASGSGLLETVAGSLLKSSSATTATTATATTTECEGGDCANCADGSCTDSPSSVE